MKIITIDKCFSTKAKHDINRIEKLDTRVLIFISPHLTYSHMLHTRGNLQNVIAYLTTTN